MRNPSAIQDLSRWPERLLNLLLAAGFGLALYYVAFECLLVNWQGDQAWLMYAAKNLLAGVPLDGSQLIETNPPLIVWLSTIPVLLAKLLHISPLLALKAVALTIIAVSTVWCRRALRMAEATIVPGLLALLVTAIALIELTIQPAEFAQREQFVVVMLLPYILAVSTGAIRKFSVLENCLLGIAAGVAVCIKPQQLLTLLCLELFFAISHRSLRRLLRPELIAAAMTGIAYVGAVFMFTPYFQQLVPLLRDTYWALGQYTYPTMLLHKGLGSLIVLSIGAIAWWKTRSTEKMPLASGALLACSFGASLAYDVQHTGWSYQMFPERAFLSLGILWLAIDQSSVRISRLFPRERYVSRAGIAMGLIAAILVVATARYREHKAAQLTTETVAGDLTKYPAQTHVAVFSSAMPFFSIILDRDLVWSSRFAHLWMLPAIIQNESGQVVTSRRFKELSAQRVAELSALQRKAGAEDLERWKPEVVFIEECSTGHTCELYHQSLDTLQWFLKSPEFSKQWSNYHEQKKVEYYDVYVRNPGT